MFLGPLTDLWHGFGIALQPANLLWCVAGCLIGNMIGVLPGMGIMATISILLPLTFALSPVAAVLMLAGIYYGAQYGGAVCAILLNLPCHPPHAVTCLDGYALTRQGRAGTALGIAMLASFLGASFGIVEIIFFAPLLVTWAAHIESPDICAVMLLGLLAGSTLARGSPLKGIAMTMVGLLLGLAGTDINTGTQRFTFGYFQLYDGLDLVALALGLFGLAEFLRSVNQPGLSTSGAPKVAIRSVFPGRAELRQAALPAIRGTIVGSLCALVPGAGPTIASFVAYAFEKKVSRNRALLGTGIVDGVAVPEAATHSSVQGDFIPTLSLGIPGDSVMALILAALIVQGITPGPQLIREHPDLFWGLIASFWIGNVLLVILNMPLIGLWVKLLSIPYRYLYPCAILFVCIGIYSVNNSFFEVSEVLAIGVIGYGLLRLGFNPAPTLLGFVLGPRMEENFRRSMLLSRGDLMIFLRSPVSAVFVTLAFLMLALQLFLWLRGTRGRTAALPVRDVS